MGRLIDADALKASLGMKTDCSECGNEWKACHYDRIYSKMDFCEWIDDAPTVHPEQHKTGKWLYRIGRGGAGWICSECGERTTSAVMGKPRYIYCPICGARNQAEE